MKISKKILVGGLIILGAILYLLSAGFSDVKTHVQLEELVAAGDQHSGDFVQTEGKVIGDSVQWDAANVRLTFSITGLKDAQLSVPVLYQRMMPENFQDATEVMISGYYTTAGGFQAEELITKCPSKYETKE